MHEMTIGTNNTNDHKFLENGSKNIVQDMALSLMVLIQICALVLNKHGNRSNAVVLETVCVVLKLQRILSNKTENTTQSQENEYNCCN